jgi:hypothetical protein
MSNVIKFPVKYDAHTRLLKEFADILDAHILDFAGRKTSLQDIAGVLADRLGEVIRHFHDKDALFEMCTKITRERFIDQ